MNTCGGVPGVENSNTGFELDSGSNNDCAAVDGNDDCVTVVTTVLAFNTGDMGMLTVEKIGRMSGVLLMLCRSYVTRSGRHDPDERKSRQFTARMKR